MRYLNLFWATLLVSLMVTACAIPPNQGRLARSFEVAQLVEAGTVLPDHTYYYTGPEAEPDAIIAINNRYELKSKYWIRVENAKEKLADWNYFIDNSTRFAHAYEGARIMTPDGQEAGIWYSRDDHTVVRFPDDSSIIVYKPVVPLDSGKPFNLYPLP